MTHMSIKWNAVDHALDCPKAANVAETSFYMDDSLTSAESVEEAIDLHQQLVTLFSKDGFLLRKWNSRVIDHIDPDLDPNVQSMHPIPTLMTIPKVWGMQAWIISISLLPPWVKLTTWPNELLSDIVKTFDVLGGLHQSWSKLICFCNWCGRQWLVVLIQNPESINQEWRSELPLLTT